MSSPSIPPHKIKSKERTLFAILLAVIVHLVIAVIIYFAVFYNKNSSQNVLPHSINQPINQSINMEITEGLQAPDSTIITGERTINTNPKNGNGIAPQTTATPTANRTDNSDATSRKPAENVTKRMTDEPLSSSKLADDTVNAATNDLTLPLTTAETEATSVADRALEPMDKASASAEYKLKQTDEYKRRDADIDKDSEQLSKLINEVKKRNQTQIQQHQTPKTTPRNDDAPIIKPDYPITPITPIVPGSSQADAAPVKKPVENRVPTAQAPETND